MAGPPIDNRERLRQALRAQPRPLGVPRALTFLRAWQSYSRPVAVSCSDGSEYVVKGLANDRAMGKAISNDQCIARLGMLIGAPVGVPALVDVPSELIQLQPELGHLQPGIAHATKLLPNCSDRMGIAYHAEPQNRNRFALLAVLYGWAVAGDTQLIYENAAPNTVHSVDHGHFFPGGPDWNEAGLQTVPSAVLDASVVTTCNLTVDERRTALLTLTAVTEAEIVATVGTLPDTWSLTVDERVTLVEFLERRRSELVALVPALN